jgi:ribosome-associated toxin RatA of RatAB toxin-antitoxin module
MRRIISTDSGRINHSAEKVFSAVADVMVYNNWWSKRVKVEVLESNADFIGSKVEIRASGGWFRCEIVSVNKPFEVRVFYYAGVQKGEGIWTIIPAGDSGAVLTYSINLEPNGFMPRLLSNFLNFSKIHSNAMKEMFTGLDKYLS